MILAGQGFSVQRTAIGAYTINLDPGRISGYPIPNVTVFDNGSRNRVTPLIQGVNFATQFVVLFLDSGGNPIDVQFSFSAQAAPVAAAATATATTRRVAEAQPQPIGTP